MAKLRQLHLKVSLPISILKEGKYFIAYTPALDVSTSGSNFEEVKRRFDEVIQIFFEELVDKKTLEEVLFSLGWQKIQKEWEPPLVITQKLESFRVPLSV